MSLHTWFRRAAGMGLVVASVVTAAPLGGAGTPIVSAQAAVDAGGEFHALTPTRILDTRPASSVGGLTGTKKLVSEPREDKSGEFAFNVLGKGGLPENASEILAVVANVTVTESTTGGYLAVFPTGFDFGGESNLETGSSLINFKTNNNVANLAIVGVDASGNFSITGQGRPGTYHVIVDVLGFISTSQYTTGGARLELVEPGRIMDTRASVGPIAAGTSRSLQVLGADTLPSVVKPEIVVDIVPNRPASVTAVLVNLTLVNNRSDSKNTHVTATPKAITAAQGSANPSNSNASGGTIKANSTVVPVDPATGTISLYNNSGNLDLVVDVLGYFETGVHTDGNRGRVVPLEAPFRSFDTRETAFGDAQLRHGSEEEWSFDNFVKSVVLNPGAANESVGPAQQGFLGTLTAIELEPLYTFQSGPGFTSYLRLNPADAPEAEVSNVNFGLGQIVPNMSLIKYGTSGADPHVIKAYNHYGQIDYLLDVYAIVLDNEAG